MTAEMRERRHPPVTWLERAVERALYRFYVRMQWRTYSTPWSRRGSVWITTQLNKLWNRAHDRVVEPIGHYVYHCNTCNREMAHSILYKHQDDSKCTAICFGCSAQHDRRSWRTR